MRAGMVSACGMVAGAGARLDLVGLAVAGFAGADGTLSGLLRSSFFESAFGRASFEGGTACACACCASDKAIIAKTIGKKRPTTGMSVANAAFVRDRRRVGDFSSGRLC